MLFPSQDPVAVTVEAAIIQTLGAASDLVGAGPATTAASVIARPPLSTSAADASARAGCSSTRAGAACQILSKS